MPRTSKSRPVETRIAPDQLIVLTLELLQTYVKTSTNGRTYLVQDAENNLYGITAVARWQGKHFANVRQIVRLQNDVVIIDKDPDDGKLAQRYLDAGVPRGQLVLAYEDEELPD